MTMIGKALATAAQFLFFNQWILLERKTGSSGNTVLPLVLWYTACEALSVFVLRELPANLHAVQYAVLFLVHLPATHISTLVFTAWEEQRPAARLLKDDTEIEHSPHDSSRLSQFYIWETSVLLAPAATAAFSNTALCNLASQAVNLDAFFAYACYLITRLIGDCIVCQRMNRSMFLGQDGVQRLRSSLCYLCLSLVSRVIVSWMLGLGLYQYLVTSLFG
ncbi:uncharacterized protein M437DRAFT_70416 [Aureobasidium melanogenum CBS 110374]|uniref:Uncharacterized protein n=1 Tax=Aureobasidium melanogenum (strain CBS 110374) TaxID=1043003 RepID=A0A074VJZ8_AURM1|nr:uncharacterized protein M437DRAFT_70416 [Aureobasidium melanogenum CBS 110374]KEQ57957.1 hypothetical protein M437DRAFT_70416 [Aureobasidium melanogenum CBS 110374]